MEEFGLAPAGGSGVKDQRTSRRTKDRIGSNVRASSPRASTMLRQLANQRERSSVIAESRGRLFGILICGCLALFCLISYSTSLRTPGSLGSVTVRFKKTAEESSFLEAFQANPQQAGAVQWPQQQDQSKQPSQQQQQPQQPLPQLQQQLPAQQQPLPQQPLPQQQQQLPQTQTAQQPQRQYNPVWDSFRPSAPADSANTNSLRGVTQQPQDQATSMQLPDQVSNEQQPQGSGSSSTGTQTGESQNGQSSVQSGIQTGAQQAGTAQMAAPVTDQQLQGLRQQADQQQEVDMKSAKQEVRVAETNAKQIKAKDPEVIGKFFLSPLAITVADVSCVNLSTHADECGNIFKNFEGSPSGLKKRLCQEVETEEQKDGTTSKKQDDDSSSKAESDDAKMCNRAKSIPKWLILSFAFSAVSLVGFLGILILCTPAIEMKERDRDVCCISIAVVSCLTYVVGLISMARLSALLSGTISLAFASPEDNTSRNSSLGNLVDTSRSKVRMLLFLTFQAVAAVLIVVVLIIEEGFRRKRTWASPEEQGEEVDKDKHSQGHPVSTPLLSDD